MTPNPPEKAAAGDTAPAAALPLLPTRELVVFPHMVAPIFVGRAKSIEAIERAFNEHSPLILSAQREPSQEDPHAADIMAVGTRVKVLQ
ncbi:MAG: LON peptidase substrate-binding domain-containing protein, partial [Actinomycetes bacterium]